jgi:hypothetical protein
MDVHPEKAGRDYFTSRAKRPFSSTASDKIEGKNSKKNDQPRESNRLTQVL